MRLTECDICGAQHDENHDWTSILIICEVEINRSTGDREKREENWDLCNQCSIREYYALNVTKAIKKAIRSVTNPTPEHKNDSPS